MVSTWFPVPVCQTRVGAAESRAFMHACPNLGWGGSSTRGGGGRGGANQPLLCSIQLDLPDFLMPSLLSGFLASSGGIEFSLICCSANGGILESLAPAALHWAWGWRGPVMYLLYVDTLLRSQSMGFHHPRGWNWVVSAPEWQVGVRLRALPLSTRFQAVLLTETGALNFQKESSAAAIPLSQRSVQL